MSQNTIARKFSARFCFVIVAACVLVAVGLFTAPIIASASSGGFPIYSWGNNISGQLGLGDYGAGTQRTTPTKVGDADNWVQVASASGASAAINTYGHLYIWGSSWTSYQMGQGAHPSPGAGNITVPTRVGTADNWVQVAVRGSAIAAAINSEGHLYAWGTPIAGNVNVPTRIAPEITWKRVTVATNIFAAISDQGHLYTWGSSNTMSGRDTTLVPVGTPGRVSQRSDWADVSTGGNAVIARAEGGEIYSWGNNDAGQLGRVPNAAHPANRPGRVGTASNWVSIGITTGNTTAAVNSDGELFTWGSTANGQLGRPATVAAPANLPGRVGAADNWVFVTSANGHFLAFNGDSELWSWGNNSDGQLGIGTTGGYEGSPQLVLQSYGFSGAARGGGLRSIMLMFTSPIEHSFNLTKDLQKPTGTPVPNLTFSFTFTPHSFNDNTTNLTPLPTIPTRTVTINSSNTSTPNSPSAGIITTRNTVDVLAGITFTQPGVYAWTVAEVQSATGIGNLSTVTFSQATYRLRVYVTQASVGAPLEIHSITIHRLTNTAGAPVNPPLKVPNLTFTNIYIRTTTGDNDYPGALTLSKTVTGQFAVLTTPFDFHVTLTRTALCPPTTNFVGRVMQGNTQIGADIAFVSGVQQTVTLMHGQRLVFDELVVGTHFTATELAATEFRASVVLFVNGQAVTVAPNTLPNLALPIGSHLIGVERNTADFTNAHAYLPPTGLGIGNYTTLLLPAVALLIVSLIALRARKRIEELSLIS